MREPACLQIPLLAVKTGQPLRENVAKKKSLLQGLLLCLAVRTRLELATPCVTGMYSNQTELPDRSHHDLKTSLFLKCGCKNTTFFPFSKEKNEFFLKIIYNTLFFNLLKNDFYTHHTSHTPAKRGKEASFLRKIGGSLHPFRVNRKRNEHKALITSQILNNHYAEASPQGLIPKDHRGFPSRSGGTGPFPSALLPSRHATKKPMQLHRLLYSWNQLLHCVDLFLEL